MKVKNGFSTPSVTSDRDFITHKINSQMIDVSSIYQY